MPPRVGLVIYGSLNLVSGGYLYDRQLVDALRAKGWEVRIFALPRRSYPLSLLDNLRPDLARAIEAANLDLLLEDELCHPSLIALNRGWRSRSGRPIVSIVHHLRTSERHGRWQKRLYREIERAYVGSVDAFVFNSQSTAASVRLLAGREQPSVIAWPAGDRFRPRIDASAIDDRARTVPPLRIVFLGNVVPRKGLDTLIDAVSMLPARSWSLSVIGDLQADPGLTRRIRQLARARGLLDRVWFAGQLTDDQIAAVLRWSHVLAVPSSYEGFGIAYLEAMSFGLPAIGTTQGGAAEIIDNGVTGWLVPPGDVLRLADVLRLFIEDSGRLLMMSHAAFERAARHPTWVASMDRAVAFLEHQL